MANKLEQLLAEKSGSRPLYMCHLIAGFPTQEQSRSIAESLIEGGADILEIQVPFSDPMADGPSIAVASRDALSQGASVSRTLALVKSLKRTATPIVLMSYINPIFRYGIEAFVRDASSSGASALIVPDAPFDTEEGRELSEATKKYSMNLIPVISPGVPKERLQELKKDGSGFVYCTTRQGITGANSRFIADLQAYTKEVREVFSIPLGLGFGIQTKSDAKRASELADIVIAGSVFVNAIRSAGKKKPGPAVKNALLRLKAH